ncbi:hypothetical protein [Cellulomonas timonensis]|uniref:hypothetical protein n=1 Tax=Cellulomonas timonensis TaxID=1689271 RepID=UPI0028FCBAD6|nr:hypothetical protein [Cellulomonas timonensis]
MTTPPGGRRDLEVGDTEALAVMIAGSAFRRHRARAPASVGAVQTIAASTACVALAALSVFQLCLAFGAPWGRFAWGGQHAQVLPTRLRVGSAVSVLVYAVFAVVLLDRAGMADLLPDGFARPAAWVLTAYFSVGVLMNGISRSRSERAVMTPAVLVLAVCSLIVSLGA